MPFDLPPVTRALLIANIAVYLLQMLTGDALMIHFALWPLGPSHYADVAGFEPWQLVTYSFLHGGFTHIAFNMLALWMFGGPDRAPVRLAAVRALLFRLRHWRCDRAIAGHGLLDRRLLPDAWRIGRHFRPPARVRNDVSARAHPPAVSADPDAGVAVRDRLRRCRAFPRRHRNAAGVAHFAHLGGMAIGFVLIQYWRGKLPVRPRRILMR